MLQRAMVTRPGEAPAKLMDPAAVCLHPLPVFREELFTARAPLAVCGYEDWAELEQLPLQEGLVMDMMGYQVCDVWGVVYGRYCQCQVFAGLAWWLACAAALLQAECRL
jgi:hypothetical protein